MEFRQRLVALMKAHGHTAASLARAAKLNQTYVRDILDGRSQNPRYGHLQKIAIELKTTVEYLMEGRNPESPPADVIGIWERIPEDRRDLAADALKIFIPKDDKARKG